MSVMENKTLRANKIERAKRIVASSTDIKPPLWARLWSNRTP